MYQINKDILRRMKYDVCLKKEIEEYYGCSGMTVRNWIKYNNPALTTWAVLCIVEKAYNMPKNEILEDD